MAVRIMLPCVNLMQTIGLAVVAGLLPFVAHWLWSSERSTPMHSLAHLASPDAFPH